MKVLIPISMLLLGVVLFEIPQIMVQSMLVNRVTIPVAPGLILYLLPMFIGIILIGVGIYLSIKSFSGR